MKESFLVELLDETMQMVTFLCVKLNVQSEVSMIRAVVVRCQHHETASYTVKLKGRLHAVIVHFS